MDLSPPVLAILIAAAAPGGGLAAQEPVADPGTVGYRGGLLFDGEGFRERDFWSAGGVLRFEAPAEIDATVELAGAYVIPPLGDAHVHAFESADRLEQEMARYLAHGIFYARNANNPRTARDAVAERVARADTPDVAYANGGLTASDAHPIPAYEGPALGVTSWEEGQRRADEIRASRLRAGDAYFVVDGAEDLERVWPRVLDGRPALVKLYLFHSEDHAARRAGGARAEGLDPELVPAIVARARAAGLRTLAHIETAHDFQVAVESGVDEVAHMAGYGIDRGDPAEVGGAVVGDELLGRAAERGLVVTPTFCRGPAMLRYLPESMRPDEETRARIADFHRETLRRLHAAGVRIAVGADLRGLTARDELFYFRDLEALDALTLLQMACELTPRVIFPERKIGRLAEGYEASFLVLPRNPLEDLDALQELSLAVKQGYRVYAAD